VDAEPGSSDELLRQSQVADLTAIEDAEAPFDVVFESVGGRSLELACTKLAPGGHILWFGQASGEPPTLDLFDVIGHAPGARLEIFSYWAADGGDLAGDLATLVRLVAQRRLHPEIGEVADWMHTDRLLTAIRDRWIRGNAVLTIPGEEFVQ
jgi:NADPH:quinone reductase-like Zn-dependent oxidoreductase